MRTLLRSKLLLICTIAWLASCDVTLDPQTFKPIDFTTEAQLDEQVAGMYGVMNQDALYGYGLWGYLNSGADQSFRNAVTQQTPLTELYTISSSETNIHNFWRHLYRGIENANIVLNVVDKPAIDETKRAQIKGQAKFLRAYYFYLLVTHFGDVPLKNMMSTELGTDFNLPRNGKKEVYDFILREMTAADTLVSKTPEGRTAARVTQTAVWAILSRVCLSMAGNPVNDTEKYKDALMYAEKVIASKLHTLNSTPHPLYPNTPAYARLFINSMQNNMNDAATTETIWEAAFLAKSATSGSYAGTGYTVTQQLGGVMGVYCPDASIASVIGFSPGTYRVLPTLYKLYAPGDQRRDWAVAPYLYKNTSPQKYYSLTVNITGGGGTGASATALTNSGGTITNVVIDNPGSGYTSAPTIKFTSYGTNTTITEAVTGANVATATATVSGGKLTAVNVVSGGRGYPTVYDRCVGKWRREYEINLPPIRQQNFTSCNVPIIRYADVLLMAAEASLKVNGPTATALEYYNQVRRRAYGYDPLVPVPGFDAAVYTMQDIMDERSRELCFEGLRRHDLLRWGVMSQAMQAVLNDNAAAVPTGYATAANLAAGNYLSNPLKFSLLPIPVNELALDQALTQNPGW